VDTDESNESLIYFSNMRGAGFPEETPEEQHERLWQGVRERVRLNAFFFIYWREPVLITLRFGGKTS